MNRIGVYAGSFDPFSLGHLEVVDSALKLFDEVIILIADNPEKKRMFDIGKMLAGIKLTCPQCNVLSHQGLVIDFCKSLQFNGTTATLIRGIRDGVDYGYEERLAKVNKEIGSIDTIYFRADKYGYVSSSMVRELLKYGKDVRQYIPSSLWNIVVY